MNCKIVMEGNAFYEIDDDCVRKSGNNKEREETERKADKEAKER